MNGIPVRHNATPSDGVDGQSAFFGAKQLIESLPGKWLFGILLLAWTTVFYFFGSPSLGYRDLRTSNLFYWMYYAYTNPGSEDTHGLIMPFVFLGLVLWKRKELITCEKREWWPGFAGLLLAGLLHVLGFAMQQQRISIVAFFLGVYSLIAVVWGRGFAARIFFPYILFVYCIPIGLQVDQLTFPLRQVSTNISVWIAQGFFGVEVLQDGIRIFDPQGEYQYEVAAACSGLRSLIALSALTTIYGFVTFQTGWKPWLFVFVSIPIALFGNIMRLLTIVLASEAFGPAAGDFVHEWFGFVIFGVAIALVMWLGHVLDDSNRHERIQPQAIGDHDVA